MASKTKKITSIGGSALIEGIMMRGPKKNTVCVRTGKDELYTEDVTVTFLAQKAKIFKLPFFRGFAGLIDSMRLSYKSLMLSADKAVESVEIDEEPSKFEKWLDEKFGDKADEDPDGVCLGARRGAGDRSVFLFAVVFV